jgi:predicted ABC-type transport system involved in lysophospholipase L1 biosynthesis ATPase subunit
MLVAAPFGKSPQLAAIASTFLAILFAIVALVVKGGPTLSPVLTLFFPPMFFVFSIIGLCGYEHNDEPPIISKPDPRDGNRLSALFVIAFINVFLYPVLAYWVEKIRYNAKNPNSGLFSRFGKKTDAPPHPEGAAIAVNNLTKTFSTSGWIRGRKMTAIDNLSFTIPTSGIWILLGANGAGKSTILSIIANLIGRDSGSITFANGASRPPRGTLGIVPQKNVLIPELTCYQTVRLWSAIKRPSRVKESKQELLLLLKDCDLERKRFANAGSLSGGQKRKLQLAIGLVGHSNSECFSRFLHLF